MPLYDLVFFPLSFAFIRFNIFSCISADKVLSYTTQASVAVSTERLDSVVSPVPVGAGTAALGRNALFGGNATSWVGWVPRTLLGWYQLARVLRSSLSGSVSKFVTRINPR